MDGLRKEAKALRSEQFLSQMYLNHLSASSTQLLLSLTSRRVGRTAARRLLDSSWIPSEHAVQHVPPDWRHLYTWIGSCNKNGGNGSGYDRD